MKSPGSKTDRASARKAKPGARPRAALICLSAASLVGAAIACTTLPTPKFDKHEFPKKRAFVEPVKRPYAVIGLVRSKVDYPTLDPLRDDEELCKNYYNKAVEDLVRMARDKGADAVIEVRSAVFLRRRPPARAP